MMIYRKTWIDIVTDTVIYALLSFVAICAIYPLLYTLLASISNTNSSAVMTGVLIIPKKICFDAYKSVFKSSNIITGYRNTLFYVTAGSCISVFLTILAGYVASRKWLYGKSLIIGFIMLPLFFNGGMIPTYLLVKQLKMTDTIWAILFPGAISVWNIIITRTFFNGIPATLEEAAKVDGANDIFILFRIFVPLSMPVIAVNILYYAVGKWNAWFEAMIYLESRSLYPLQMFLREILIRGETNDMGMVSQYMAQNVKYATIIVSILPIICVYPFLQKYFVQGVMIGAVKG